MRTSNPLRVLIGIALILAGLQAGSLLFFWQLPAVPDALPAHRVGRPPPGEPPPPEAVPDADRRALLALIQILDARLAAAEVGQTTAGQTQGGARPPADHLAAALADPRPGQPAVQTLIADYGSLLAAAGQRLDLTNNPDPATVVEKRGPGQVPPLPPPSGEIPPR